MTAAVRLENVSKYYDTGAGRFHALSSISLEFPAGQMVGLIGPSGSGKSTLLNLVSGIDHPSSGSVTIAERPLNGLSEGALAHFRGRHIGIVFQFFQLVPTLTVLENVTLAMDLVGAVPRNKRRARALELLQQMSIERHADKLPAKLSGGEQQRVAIARALANDPAILVADEPTGNLDSENSDRINQIFADCAGAGRLVIMATHQADHLDRFDRVVALADGMIERDRTNGGPAHA